MELNLKLCSNEKIFKKCLRSKLLRDFFYDVTDVVMSGYVIDIVMSSYLCFFFKFLFNLVNKLNN